MIFFINNYLNVACSQRPKRFSTLKLVSSNTQIITITFTLEFAYSDVGFFFAVNDLAVPKIRRQWPLPTSWGLATNSSGPSHTPSLTFFAPPGKPADLTVSGGSNSICQHHFQLRFTCVFMVTLFIKKNEHACRIALAQATFPSINDSSVSPRIYIRTYFRNDAVFDDYRLTRNNSFLFRR